MTRAVRQILSHRCLNKTMKKNVISTILRSVSIALGAILLCNALIVTLASNFNLGIVLTCLLGALLLAGGVWWPQIVRSLPRFVWITMLIGLACVVVCTAALLLYGQIDRVTHDEDVIIVLGAGIHGERVSLTLRDRLDAAVAYYEQNPAAILVVTGGQGHGEDITEALAMERYLLEKGVPAENIWKEERATSTYENFVFSKAMIDERLGAGCSAVYVTTDFHIFRAGQVAKRVGLDHVSHVHSDTAWFLVVPSCLRECLAVLWYWVSGAS